MAGARDPLHLHLTLGPLIVYSRNLPFVHDIAPVLRDAEHPTDITPSHQATKGPMTRARARAIEHEVTSLLYDSLFDVHGTWMLPQSEILCMIRYNGNEDGLEDARSGERQAWKERGEAADKAQFSDVRIASDVQTTSDV